MKNKKLKRAGTRLVGGLSLTAISYVILPALIASAAIFTATIINNANTFSSGNLLMKGTTPTSVVCTPPTGSIASSNSTTCPGNPLPTTTLTTTAASAGSTLTAVGSISAASGLLTSTGCGLQYFAEGVSGDTALPFYGVTYGTTMSQLSSTAATFDGSTGYAETLALETDPANFTFAGWFKTSTKQGTILSFSNNQNTTLTADNDRELWLDSTGRLVWATTTNGTTLSELTSTATYVAGTWNFFTVSISAADGDRLFVNGALVASSATTTAYNYNGYWHFGWGSELNTAPAWTNKPTNAYFNGSLNGMALFGSALSTPQISTLYADATQATYNAQVTADAASFYWPMTDTGTTPYTGAVPTLSTPTPTLADASGNANTGKIEGTVTQGVPGPTTLGGAGVTLPGTTGSDIYTTNSYSNPPTLSASIWFKTTSQGSIMGGNTTQLDSTPTSWDRDLWIDPTGHLVFGINDAGSLDEVTSPGTYNDGNWHFVVVTYGALGEYMYVDGVQVAYNSAGLAGQAYTMYWHLGYAYILGWTDTSTDYNFNGSLSQAGLYNTQLTASQVANLYSAPSAADEESRALSMSPISYWPLTDTVASPACPLVEVTIQTVASSITACVVPAGSGACPAPSTSVYANTIGTHTMTSPATGGPVSITVTMKLAAAAGTGIAGLHLLVPLTFYEKNSTFSSQLVYPDAVAIL